jgi:hypothetical protein
MVRCPLRPPYFSSVHDQYPLSSSAFLSVVLNTSCVGKTPGKAMRIWNDTRFPLFVRSEAAVSIGPLFGVLCFILYRSV